MTVRFEQPLFLWLILLAVPLAVIGWYRLTGTDAIRRSTLIAIRTVVLAALLLSLSGLSIRRNVDRVTVIGIADISDSVKTFAHLSSPEAPKDSDNLGFLRWWFRKASQQRLPGDRFGLVVFDGGPRAVTAPTAAKNYNDEPFDVVVREGTNIEQAIQYALAMFPPDTRRRLVLFTDGVQTAGDALAAAAQSGAAGGNHTSDSAADSGSASGVWDVPIDVVPIKYRVDHEIQVDRIEAPSTARPGQRITVRIVIESTHKADALLDLTLEGAPVDLNGSAEGTSRAVHLKPGINVQTADVTLTQAAVNRFEAHLIPLKPGDDTIRANDSAQAFTVTPDKGSVLVLDGVPGISGRTLPGVLQDAGLAVRVVGPTDLPANPIELQSYDLVILENVPAEDLSHDEQQRLVNYVQAFGGGLLMVGGYDSFGAGGWIDTPLDPVMPVQMRIPDDITIPTAAIAIVLDRSGSMNESAGRGESKIEVASEAASLAVRTLEPTDLVTVIAFSQWPDTVVPLQKVKDGKAISDAITAITANGGTNMGPALEAALDALKNSKAEVRHIVCLSDGRSQPADFEGIVQRIRDSGITLSTIAVGHDADVPMMNHLATAGGGQFYDILRPEVLPRVFVKDIRIVRRPLIREAPFTPVFLPTGSSITSGLQATAPKLYGFVLTQPRPDPSVEMFMKTPDGKPLMAQWQSGLGKVGAFTSDARDNWARDWIAWPGYRQLWTGFARNLARPVGSDEFDLSTSLDGDQLLITLNQVRPDDPDHSAGKVSSNSVPEVALSIPGTVYGPDDQAQAVRLKPTGPSTYSARVEARHSGSYMVALTPRSSRTGQISLVVGGLTRKSGIEYRQLQSDSDMLKRIAGMTGGRLLDPQHPESADLFDRKGLPRITAIEPLSIPLLLLAIGLFLADVAARRIAWSGAALVRWLESIVRIEPRQPGTVIAGAMMQAGTAAGAACLSAAKSVTLTHAGAEQEASATTVAGSYRKALSKVEQRYRAAPRRPPATDSSARENQESPPDERSHHHRQSAAGDASQQTAQAGGRAASTSRIRVTAPSRTGEPEEPQTASPPPEPSIQPMPRITRKQALAIAQARRKAMSALTGRGADNTDQDHPGSRDTRAESSDLASSSTASAALNESDQNNATDSPSADSGKVESDALFKRLSAARKRAHNHDHPVDNP